MPKSKGALDITGENLEDLLAYDDHFLDYFNCFLALPVFPQALVYNRLTGAFDEVDDVRTELSGSLPPISPAFQYGPTDEERERMLEWARQERLPLFLRTQLFRELKLVKLLIRPLDVDRQLSRESSRNIRGYSRASESYISSLSMSGDNSGNNNIDEFEYVWGEPDYNALYPYQRPGSRALSLPAKLYFDGKIYDSRPSITSATVRSSGQASMKAMSAMTSNTDGADSEFRLADLEEKHELRRSTEVASAASGGRHRTRKLGKVELVPTEKNVNVMARKADYKSKSSLSQAPPSSTEEAFLRGARALSAPVNFVDYLRMPRQSIQHFEAFFGEVEPENDGQTYVQFEEEEGVSEEQTEVDMRNLEGRLKMSVQQVKEKILGSHNNFEEFRQFLQGTSGEYLLSFWLECENFKDTMEDFDDAHNMETRNTHFKNIQDKYKLKLTPDALDQIKKAANNVGLSHTIFLRTQYDVLRRLRAYWVPRFLIHCEMSKGFNFDEEVDENADGSGLSYRAYKYVAMEIPAARQTSGRQHLPFFPSISLVHSMPVLPEDAKDYANKLLMNVSFDNSTSSQRRMFPRQRSTVSARSRRSGSSMKRSTKERFVQALSADRLAGGPFSRYLAKLEDQRLLDSLLFWEDVTEFGSTEDRSSDRLLRLCHAWSIFHKYLAEDSPHRIELPEKETKHLHHSLERARDFMEASIFDHAKVLAVENLEKAWVRFLKEDLKTYLDCRVKPGKDSPPSTAEAIEITVTEYDIVIKRPRPWIRRIPGSTASERARRLNKALLMAEDMDDTKKAKRLAEARERRKEMERERRKAIRAAYARLRASKEQKLNDSSSNLLSDDHLLTASKAENVPSIQEVAGNKPVMNMFRKYVSDDDKETNNIMQLYNDLETFFSLKDHKTRRDAQALHIAKLYLDPEGKRHINLNNEELAERISEVSERPTSAVLQDIHTAVMPKVEEIFKEFMMKQADELGIEPQDLATISQSELTMRQSTEQAMIASWDKKKLKGKENELNLMSKSEEMKQHMEKLRQLEFASVKVNVMEGSPKGKSAQAKKLEKPSTRSRKSASKKDSSKSIVHQDGFEVAQRGNTRLVEKDRGNGGIGDRRITGRAPPTREDKNEFLSTLSQSAMGNLSILLLYFYKYLLKHGPEDEMPQLDKDLFFYIEVQKFKDGSHNYSDEEMLKRKVQSIVDCFLDSVYLPTLQIDIPIDLHQKALKAAQRYVGGRDIVPTLFDDAQIYIFKELLFYWAGFRRATTKPADLQKRPVLKYEKMLRRRLENIENYQVPSSELSLPSIPEGAVPSFSISLSEGIKFKELDESNVGTPLPDQLQKDRKGSRAGMLLADGQAIRSRGSSGRNSLVAR
ncbi:unnamed protein product [Lymnaea stagnalis]|uniref:RGS domain-containing protein n=1 Tax=Lymnaea stagnalis TaxID=6523 RepID=A0AAV2H1Q8_LYMST